MASNISPNSFIEIRYPVAAVLLMPKFVAQSLCGRHPFADAMEVDGPAVAEGRRVELSGERDLISSFALGFGKSSSRPQSIVYKSGSNDNLLKGRSRDRAAHSE
jgi:hypothetical protein